MGNFIKSIKRLSDGGLAEDTYAFMERVLDEDTNKEKMISLDKVRDILYDMLHNQHINDSSMVGTFAYDNVVDFVEDFCKSLEE